MDKFGMGFRLPTDDKNKADRVVQIDTSELMKSVEDLARTDAKRLTDLCLDFLSHSAMATNGRMPMEAMEPIRMTLFAFNNTYVQIYLEQFQRIIGGITNYETLRNMGVDPIKVQDAKEKAAQALLDAVMKPVNDAITRIEKITNDKEEKDKEKGV